ncbi:MAG: hypothetical protein SFY81_02105 [Verrucomicrobiota bacterium]|nr:hypothetical protein [Verrucomicrobiota bacterium]
MNISLQSVSQLAGITLANDRSPLDNGLQLPGQVCLANESRFMSSYFSDPLTAYATGWRDPNGIEATLDFIAPPVQVGRRFEYKKSEHTEAFLSDGDDGRQIGADFKHIEFRGSTVNEKTNNRGLTIRVDLDQVGNMPNWREVYTSRLLQRLLRNELRRAVNTISAAASSTAKTWDTTAGKDPDNDILADLLAAADDSGLRPNRILFGDLAWHKRIMSHRAQATAGGYASAALTPVELAGFLGVDGVMISRERYQAGPATKGKIVPDIVLGFYGEDGLTPEDPSNCKRFWSAVEGGGKYRVYEQPISAKLIDLTVEHYSNVIITSTIGLRKLTIT